MPENSSPLKKLLVIAGTRPEIIKQAPLVFSGRNSNVWNVRLCFTGQHREMGNQILADIGLRPDVTLDLMQPDQSPESFLGAAIPGLAAILRDERPNWVAVQGDTTTALAGALAAFYQKIPVLHVEAGLRTYDLRAPFPEEMHRQAITRLAAAHAAPTEHARTALRREHVSDEAIIVSGNTGIDCLLHTVRQQNRPPLPSKLDAGEARVWRRLFDDVGTPTTARMILITGHRRESFGPGFESICRAIAGLARRYPDVDLVYPVHLNPHVRAVVHRMLSTEPNVHLIGPQAYRPFVTLLNRSTLILTDSGGIQEEAPALGKPVLVMRNVTERPEAVECGAAHLVGNDEEKIVAGVSALLDNPDAYARMAVARFPYGDGTASSIILDWLNTKYAPRTPIGNGT